MSKKSFGLFLLVMALIISVSYNVHLLNRPRYEPVKSDTAKVVIYKEHKDTKPKEVNSGKVVGHIGIPIIPPYYDEEDIGCSDCNIDTLDFPIVQKTFGDSLYTAYVSGAVVGNIEPQLDSIKIMERIETVTITNTVIKKRHLHWGITGGAGYGVINKKPDIFIGVGVMYEF